MNVKKQLLFFGVLTLLLLASCQKRKARKTLEGSWNVIAARGQVSNNCTDRDSVLNLFDTLIGTIEFERKQVTRDFAISGMDAECYAYVSRKDKQEWKVTRHQEVLFTANTYLISIGDEQWQCLFGKGQLGEEANNQDHAHLVQISDHGDAITYEIERYE